MTFVPECMKTVALAVEFCNHPKAGWAAVHTVVLAVCYIMAIFQFILNLTLSMTDLCLNKYALSNSTASDVSE